MSTSNAVPSSHINDITDLDPLLQPVWRHYTRKVFTTKKHRDLTYLSE